MSLLPLRQILDDGMRALRRIDEHHCLCTLHSCSPQEYHVCE